MLVNRADYCVPKTREKGGGMLRVNEIEERAGMWRREQGTINAGTITGNWD